MSRFLVKRSVPYHYSDDSSLGIWMPLEKMDETRGFATADEAFAAIGRYTVKTLASKPKRELILDDILRWLDVWVVEVSPPGPSTWTEVRRMEAK